LWVARTRAIRVSDSTRFVLQCIVQNVLNIELKSTKLIAQSGAKPKFSETSPLEIINEDENHVAFDVSSPWDVFVEERAGDGDRSYDTRDETIRAKRQNDLQTSMYTVDVHGRCTR